MYIYVQRRNSRREQGMVPPKLRRVEYSSLYPPQKSSPQLLTQNCATVYVHTYIYT